MPKKFNGPLGRKRLKPRVTLNYLNRERDLRNWANEDVEKILSLCDEYGIETGDGMFLELALALAQDFVPGFQEKKKTGPRKKWTARRCGIAVVEVERVMHKNGCSAQHASHVLANLAPWNDFLTPRDKQDKTGNPGEALYQKYKNNYRTELGSRYRLAFIARAEADERAEWDEEVASAFSDWE